MRAGFLIALLVVAFVAAVNAFQFSHLDTGQAAAEDATRGSVVHGHALVRQVGCIACHSIPSFPGTIAHVGPPLDHFALRAYVAGVAENTPDNVIKFIQDPRSIAPKSAMPNLHLSEDDARDLAAFLYTLQ
jgi:cytochrome c2